MQAQHRLVCLTWAGGLSSVFHYWNIPNVEIVAVPLPGREK